jgi:uncharacterized protein
MKGDDVTYPNIKQSVYLCLWILPGMAIAFLIGSLHLGFPPGLDKLIFYALSMSLPLCIGLYSRSQILNQHPINFSSKNWKIYILLLIAVPMLKLGIISPLVELISSPSSEAFKTEIINSVPDTGIYSFLYLVLIAPIVEEVLFRGIMLEGLSKKYSPVVSIMFTSFLFGISHINPWQILFTFILGLLFGWLYLKTRSLVPSIFCHILNNLVSFLFLLFIYGSDWEDVDQILFGSYWSLLRTVILSLIFFSISMIVLSKTYKTYH